METDLSQPVDGTPHPPSLHPERKARIDLHRYNEYEKEAVREVNPMRISISDIMMKENAFKEDIKLPLFKTVAHISGLRRGEDVAKGYERVVADGESLWLELNKEEIYLTNFRKRQRTQSRQYWTMNGVTIHQQLTLEPGKYPRRHKLSVKPIDRPGCSSNLEAG